MQKTKPGSLPLPETEYYLKRIRRPLTYETKTQVRQLWHDRCAYCGAVYSQFHYDHIFPHALGGPDTVENLVYACHPCNMAKGSRVLPGHTPGEMIRAFQHERLPYGPYPAIPAIYRLSLTQRKQSEPVHYPREVNASKFLLGVAVLIGIFTIIALIAK